MSKNNFNDAFIRSVVAGVIAIGAGTVVSAQDAGAPALEILQDIYPGKAYSPYAGRSFPNNVYWGESHVHTGYSLDAGLFGATTGPDDAFRLARGEEIMSSTGQPVKLSRPLDFLVVTDHSDLMGIATDIQNGTPNIVEDPKGKEWADGFAQGGAAAGEAAFDLITAFGAGTIPKQMLEDYSPGSPIYTSVWEKTVDFADYYNEPNRFTAFIGFEWTSVPKGMNLHRNVILRDSGLRAKQVVPLTTQEPDGTVDPLDLYQWLEDYEKNTGGHALAISHNGNLSNGWMFPMETRYSGANVDKDYVELRSKWEPLYEATQMKGDGETHPALSPDDEFADYGTWDTGNLDLTELKTPDMIKQEYAREALKNGLLLEKRYGTNPYKFGMVGGTDTHTGLSTAEEDNFFSKSTTVEPSKTRVSHPFVESKLGAIEGDTLVASGYQGIWATENTRGALFDAMERKETYATTGPRMTVRFFGGWDFNEDDIRSRQLAFVGYSKGVPMGGDMSDAPAGKAPSFMTYALRDPIGANLDRIQIVKGWMDADGVTQEKVYDVAWSGDREPDSNGKVGAVGNTVDVATANWTNTIGASELVSVWTDPDFDASESAFYYVRVIEIPTPRWILYDQLRLGAELPEGAELIHQERAYTSPIWYSPS
jgi:hypothetical protein